MMILFGGGLLLLLVVVLVVSGLSWSTKKISVTSSLSSFVLLLLPDCCSDTVRSHSKSRISSGGKGSVGGGDSVGSIVVG